MSSEGPSAISPDYVLRHLLATVAYRGAKVLQASPPAFPELDLGSGVRSPREILAHISLVLEYACAIIQDKEPQKTDLGAWEEEVDRFYATLAKVDGVLVESRPLEEAKLLKVLQGPFADVLTHIGQLATMRRLAGEPVPGESFIAADIVAGRVGRDQADARKRK